jgi:hypothetical protein
MMIEQGRDESMQETVEAIAQLAMTTSSDRGTVATLTTTNTKLATQLEAAHALIAQLKSEITKLRHSRSRLNLYGKGSDRKEPQITTVIADRTGSKSLSHTLVLHATLGKLGIKKRQQRSTPWVEFNGTKNDAEGQLRT